MAGYMVQVKVLSGGDDNQTQELHYDGVVVLRVGGGWWQEAEGEVVLWKLVVPAQKGSESQEEMLYHLEVERWEAPAPEEAVVRAHGESDQCLPTMPATRARSKKFPLWVESRSIRVPRKR